MGWDQTSPTDDNLYLAPFQPVLRSEFEKTIQVAFKLNICWFLVGSELPEQQ